MQQDFEMGKELIKTHGKNLSVRSLVIDWNRFDYEGGETEMHEAVLVAAHGYTSAGGVIDYTQSMEEQEDGNYNH